MRNNLQCFYFYFISLKRKKLSIQMIYRKFHVFERKMVTGNAN
ncbi:hypothetical protein BZA02_10133 [Ruegeria sp. P4]|nr:hypothetical protein BZA02_10133 [Ruegeria sp. P4]